jgi:hypothetical protein
MFPPDSTQDDVYLHVGQPLLNDLMNGYNGCLFAYGQTGSGKTYSMQGILPRLLDELFARIESESSAEYEFLLRVSYIELYMERIRDLLDPDPGKANLDLHEDNRPGGRGVYVQDLTEVYVSTSEEVHALLAEGNKQRSVGATKMNSQSSRSHSLFCLHVQSRSSATGQTKSATLNVVDLAGSEKVAKTEASGLRLQEAAQINLSLTRLGMVIKALVDAQALGWTPGQSTNGKSLDAAPVHIPYRESKLTRLLQHALGGNARTTLLINISPAGSHFPETVSSLAFGARAKRIKNKPVRNVEMSPAELKRELLAARELIRQLVAENEMLKRNAMNSTVASGSNVSSPTQLSVEDQRVHAEVDAHEPPKKVSDMSTVKSSDDLDRVAQLYLDNEALRGENADLRSVIETLVMQMRDMREELDSRPLVNASVPDSGVQTPKSASLSRCNSSSSTSSANSFVPSTHDILEDEVATSNVASPLKRIAAEDSSSIRQLSRSTTTDWTLAPCASYGQIAAVEYQLRALRKDYQSMRIMTRDALLTSQFAIMRQGALLAERLEHQTMAFTKFLDDMVSSLFVISDSYDPAAIVQDVLNSVADGEIIEGDVDLYIMNRQFNAILRENEGSQWKLRQLIERIQGMRRTYSPKTLPSGSSSSSLENSSPSPTSSTPAFFSHSHHGHGHVVKPVVGGSTTPFRNSRKAGLPVSSSQASQASRANGSAPTSTTPPPLPRSNSSVSPRMLPTAAKTDFLMYRSLVGNGAADESGQRSSRSGRRSILGSIFSGSSSKIAPRRAWVVLDYQAANVRVYESNVPGAVVLQELKVSPALSIACEPSSTTPGQHVLRFSVDGTAYLELFVDSDLIRDQWCYAVQSVVKWVGDQRAGEAERQYLSNVAM